MITATTVNSLSAVAKLKKHWLTKTTKFTKNIKLKKKSVLGTYLYNLIIIVLKKEDKFKNNLYFTSHF